MLRTRNCVKSIPVGHVLGRPSKAARLLSSLTDQPKADSVYSLPYAYHTPSEVLLTPDQTVTKQSTAHATSIEEVKVQKSAFDVYRSLLQDSSTDATPLPHANHDSVDLKELFQRQLDLEQELNHATAVQSIRNILKLTEMGKSANLKSVQRVLLEWYEPFVACLDEKIEAIGTMHKLETKILTKKDDKKMNTWKTQLKEKKEQHDDLTKHGPILTFLPTEKLAVITMNAVVNHILSSGNRANAAVLCKDIADIVETEVNLAKSMGQKLWVKSWQKEQVKDTLGKPQIVKALGRQIRKYYGEFVTVCGCGCICDCDRDCVFVIVCDSVCLYIYIYIYIYIYLYVSVSLSRLGLVGLGHEGESGRRPHRVLQVNSDREWKSSTHARSTLYHQTQEKSRHPALNGRSVQDHH
jgi:hypothetical protein